MVANVVTFSRLLAGRGLRTGPSRSQTALEALGAVDANVRDDVYWALCCTFVSGPEERAAFDAAFAEFWEGAPASGLPDSPGEQAPAAHDGSAAPATSRGVETVATQAGQGVDEDGAEDDVAGLFASWEERLGELDFRAYGEEELREARKVMARLARAMPRRLSRRLERAARGSHLDARETLRKAMRTEGHPLQRAWRRRRTAPRRIVFVLDVSGSMRHYARPLLIFCQATGRAHRNVETFTFGTRLTRLTTHLRNGDPDAALAQTLRAIPDWAGGTRIGENLRAFNERWGRRGMTRGAVVVIVSDGWERGDVGLLERELGRVHRASHRVVWLNPLAGDPGYEPLAAGMAAALPHIDVFLPGHNLRSVAALAGVLVAL